MLASEIQLICLKLIAKRYIVQKITISLPIQSYLHADLRKQLIFQPPKF